MLHTARPSEFIPQSASALHESPVRGAPVIIVEQRPAAQLWPAAQRVPQAPQLFTSVVGSTHAVPHIMRGALQVPLLEQVLFTHSCPDGHGLLQRPQCVALKRVSRHVPLQLVSVATGQPPGRVSVGIEGTSAPVGTSATRASTIELASRRTIGSSIAHALEAATAMPPTTPAQRLDHPFITPSTPARGSFATAPIAME